MIGSKYLVFLLSIFLFSCFPNKKVTLREKSEVTREKKITAPTKVFLDDASIILYKNGFASSTPSPSGIEDPFYAEQLSELRKYARFPQGLDESQFKSYLPEFPEKLSTFQEIRVSYVHYFIS